MTIETHPEMDAKIIELLRWDTGNPLMLYAARRIEELETTNIHLERLDAASQQALMRTMHENRVRNKCLGTAVDALELDAPTDSAARHALNYIRQRLAELETEEETE